MISRECGVPPMFSGSRKSPVQSLVCTWWRSFLLRLRSQEVSVSALERHWNLDGRTCAEAATEGNASGSTARSDRTSAGSADATTVDDRCEQSSTNSTSYTNCPRARRNLFDLRVGNKLETIAGETHESKGWSFKMREYIAAVDEELFLELVNVEANPLR